MQAEKHLLEMLKTLINMLKLSSIEEGGHKAHTINLKDMSIMAQSNLSTN